MINSISKFIDNFLFPKRCIACGKNDTLLCRECSDSINTYARGFCFSCGKENDDFSVCKVCKKDLSLDGLYVAGSYESKALKKIIWELKYNFIKNMSSLAGGIIIDTFGNRLDNQFVLTFVPLHKKRLRYRGFNQSEEIAKFLGEKGGLKVEDLLVRKKDTQSQTELTRFERKANMDGVFDKKTDVVGKKIYIIDDVITTGATLNSCAEVLKKNGAKEVWGIVLVRD